MHISILSFVLTVYTWQSQLSLWLTQNKVSSSCQDNIVSIITEYTKKHEIDPWLVISVGWVESRWRITTIGSAGEVGALQVLPQSLLKTFFEKEYNIHPQDKETWLIENKLYVSRIKRFMKANLCTAAIAAGIWELAWWKNWWRKREHYLHRRYSFFLKKRIPLNFFWVGHYNWGTRPLNTRYPWKVYKIYKEIKPN